MVEKLSTTEEIAARTITTLTIVKGGTWLSRFTRETPIDNDVESNDVHLNCVSRAKLAPQGFLNILFHPRSAYYVHGSKETYTVNQLKLAKLTKESPAM